jgi:hypothetical protein
MNHQSTITHQSVSLPGVAFDVLRITYGRRLDLMKLVRALAQRREFHEAGDTPADRMQAAELSLEIDQLYLQWGLQSVNGLTIDGEPATPQNLWQAGPEALTREIIAAIRSAAGLTEDERKN